MTFRIAMKVESNHRHARLGRADWRLLLPSVDGFFPKMVLLGGSDGQAERILENGFAGRVEFTLQCDSSADAVIVFKDAAVDLHKIAKSLRTGGALYHEIDRRSPASWTATPGRTKRRMACAGLSPTGVYWAAPNFRHCKRYIPLDRPEAFRWYLSTLFVAGTPYHRLIEIAIRFYSAVANNHMEGLAPGYVVTAVKGSEQEIPPSVLAHPDLPTEFQVPGLRPVVLTSGHDDGSRSVILPFVPGKKNPLAVLKVSTRRSFNANTEHEQAILEEIRSHLEGPICQTIPHPLGLLHYGDLAVSMETFAPGYPLLVSSGRWRASFTQQVADLNLAADWLGDFHLQAQVERMLWDESALERWIEAPVNAYANAFGVTEDEAQLFQQVRERAQSLLGASLPRVWMHFDYGPWNLYRKEQDFTVIDWEFGRDWERERTGPALYDLLYFVTYWIHVVKHFVDESGELLGFYNLFLQPYPRDLHIRAARQVLDSYMHRLDIDPRFLPLVLVYLWVEQAIHQDKRKRTLGQVSAETRRNNASVRRVELLAGHIEPLFNHSDNR